MAGDSLAPGFADEKIERSGRRGAYLSRPALIGVPFMIAAGVYEEAINEAHTKRMAELIPGAQSLLIGNASHFAHWQQVDAVNTAILEFLAPVSEAAGSREVSTPLHPC